VSWDVAGCACVDLNHGPLPYQERAPTGHGMIQLASVLVRVSRDGDKSDLNRLIAKADADRAARLGGHKSLFRRLLERLRPHRQEPGGDPQGNYGTSDDPGR